MRKECRLRYYLLTFFSTKQHNNYHPIMQLFLFCLTSSENVFHLFFSYRFTILLGLLLNLFIYIKRREGIIYCKLFLLLSIFMAPTFSTILHLADILLKIHLVLIAHRYFHPFSRKCFWPVPQLNRLDDLMSMPLTYRKLPEKEKKNKIYACINLFIFFRTIYFIYMGKEA